MSLGDGSLNLPYEDLPEPAYGEEIDLSDAALAGGMVTMAAAVSVGEGREPAIVFRFASPEGEFYKPMVLVVSAEEMESLATVVGDTARAAVDAVRKGL